MKTISLLLFLLSGLSLLKAQNAPAPDSAPPPPEGAQLESSDAGDVVHRKRIIRRAEAALLETNVVIQIEAKGLVGGDKALTMAGCGPEWLFNANGSSLTVNFRLKGTMSEACRLEFSIQSEQTMKNTTHKLNFSGEAIFAYGEPVTLLSGDGKSLVATVTELPSPKAPSQQ